MRPLQKHLLQLEQELWEWLERGYYEEAPLDKQAKLRKKGILPSNFQAEMPEIWPLYQKCRLFNALPYAGGILDQPHITMLELELCERVEKRFNQHKGLWNARLGEDNGG